LSGLVPVGAFLAEHFWSNSAALVSPEKYNAVSQELQTIPFRPICRTVRNRSADSGFTVGTAVYIWLSGKSNVSQISLGEELAVHAAAVYRADCICLYRMAFVHERWLTEGRSTYDTVYADLQIPGTWRFLWWGILASSFHLGVGVWNFLCKWGLRRRCGPQRAAGQLGVVVGFNIQSGWYSDLDSVSVLIGIRFPRT